MDGAAPRHQACPTDPTALIRPPAHYQSTTMLQKKIKKEQTARQWISSSSSALFSSPPFFSLISVERGKSESKRRRSGTRKGDSIPVSSSSLPFVLDAFSIRTLLRSSLFLLDLVPVGFDLLRSGLVLLGVFEGFLVRAGELTVRLRNYYWAVSAQSSDASFPRIILTICERRFRLLDFLYAPSVGRFLNLSLLVLLPPVPRCFCLFVASNKRAEEASLGKN
ncbi:hypothetical protein Cni_G14777 [Canna indica]|uniref:Uncharacterized protein n=1 Tax=Canna indica TaxID=4628 RepID=A0AAQ3QF30_9LILI|nr:hypothetical protein Cni_G14777 [Canna indica]